MVCRHKNNSNIIEQNKVYTTITNKLIIKYINQLLKIVK